MPETTEDWARKILDGDRRAIARAISAVESRDEAGVELLKALFPKCGRAFVIGVTGSPGTGKSTLVEKLGAEYRAAGMRVGIVAVDPTSPFSGGAILGDRIRMQRLSTDEGVYIRSMATRGELGGLAPATHDVVSVLDAAGCQVVIVETVGVGQDEVEVARLAEVTALLQVPGLGDEVQAFKAGVLEIADLFVINKSDRPGADRVEQDLHALLAHSARSDGWRPPVLKTVATTGEGVPRLRESLDEFRQFAEKNGLLEQRRREHWRRRVLGLVRQRLFEKLVEAQVNDGSLDKLIEEVVGRRRDPHSVVEQILETLTPGPSPTGRGATG